MNKEKKSETTDGIKKSISETTRAISGNDTLKIKFSADPSGDYGEVIKLPQISKEPTELEILKVRGTADSLALQARFKDEETFSKYDPSGEQAKEIYHEPYLRFKGTKYEQETFFVKDPNENILEIKTLTANAE